MNLSPNFTLAELTRSERAMRDGIPNVPTPEHVANLTALAVHILQPLRDHFGEPIPVTSGYRSKELNLKTPGASQTSQHSTGQAADLDMKRAPKSRLTNAALFHYIRQNLPFDQLIFEFGTKTEPSWVHVSYAPEPRGIVLRCTGTPKAPKYAPWKG